jgi:hypothetical protein
LPAVAGGIAADRQDVADRLVETLAEHLREPRSLEGVFELRVEGIHVGGEAPFTPQVIEGIFVGGEDELRVEPEALCHARQEALGSRVVSAVVDCLIREQLRVLPDRLTVGAPETIQRPAWQLLARIPFSLSEMRKTFRGVLLAQPVIERGRQLALVGTQRRGIPLGAVGIVPRHERRLAAHREADVAVARDPRRYGVAELLDLRPVEVRVGLRDARRFPDAADLHVMPEGHLALVDRTRHRRRGRRFGRARERNMAFAREQARRGIESDPATAWQVHLAPRVQVGEILFRPRRAIERLHVRRRAGSGSRTRSAPQTRDAAAPGPAASGVAARA